jgi:hypothetical protein
MRLGNKADLLHCIESVETDSPATHVVDAVFLDGAAVVQMLSLGTAKTMQIVCLCHMYHLNWRKRGALTSSGMCIYQTA